MMRSRTSKDVALEAKENVVLVRTAESSASSWPVIISSILVEEFPSESKESVKILEGIVEFGERGVVGGAIAFES